MMKCKRTVSQSVEAAVSTYAMHFPPFPPAVFTLFIFLLFFLLPLRHQQQQNTTQHNTNKRSAAKLALKN